MTLIEVTLAVAVFSIIIAATLNVAAQAIALRAQATRVLVAGQLADALIAEIMQLPYDSTDTQQSGTVASLTALNTPILTVIPASRGNDATLADYANYKDNTPINADGSLSTNANGYRRSVTAKYVSTSNPSVESATDTGLCRITVTVTFNKRPILTRTALKANLTPKS
ncbi:MAG: type II secretion system protein [Phycisphaerales bacterium]|nr:type II secretion system protein [Phycisphaerales bacterium]